MHCSIVTAAILALFTGFSVRAQTFYVDGQVGSDIPTSGSSASTPWATIGYAISQIAPPASGSAEVRIAGGQVYSGASNGEAFPLALPPRITLRAEPAAAPPVLGPSIGQSAIVLDEAATYLDDYLLCERLTFNGGTHGIVCGSVSTETHALALTGCEFVGQSGAGICATSSSSVLELNVTGCEFVGFGQLANGIEARMISIGCVQNIEVVGCRFRGLQAGMLTAGDTVFSADAGHMNASIQRCDFSDCYYGMHLRHPPEPLTTGSYLVTSTRVADCGIGIAIRDSGHLGDKVLVVDECWIRSCGTGVMAGGLGPFSENITVDLQGTTIASCVLGTRLAASPWTYNWLYAADVTWSDNVAAFEALAGGDNSGVGVDLRRCRVLGGVDGLRMDIDSTADSHVRVESCLLASCSGDAIFYSAFGGQVGYPSYAHGTFRHMTIADCGRGLVIAQLPLHYAADNSVFSNNAADLDIVATVSDSMTDGLGLVGVGNTTVPDLLLLRPSYKPASASPVIDAGTTTTSVLDYEGDQRPEPGSAPDVGADEFYAAGSSRTFGTAMTGASVHRPAIGPSGVTPTIGASMPITLTLTPPPSSAAFAVLGIGYEDARPLELTAIAPGSMVWVAPAALTQPMLIPATGIIGINQFLPPVPGLAGLPFHAQWIVLLSGGQLATSGGLRVTIGS